MYSPNVRIGNWIEDVGLEKEKTIAFMRKRERFELLVQRTRRLFGNLLRETRLSKNIEGFVKFESCIQLKAPDMPGFPPSKEQNVDKNLNNMGVVLTATIHDKYVGSDEITKLVNDCQLIASPILVPCLRNTFVIKSADNIDRTGQNLLFGQEFALQIVNSSEGKNENLYVRAEKPLIDGPHGPLDHNPVRLSNKKDCYSIWKILHWDRESRFETEGAPFPPFIRVVVRNAMSGLNLAVEGTIWWQSVFGNECGLSVHTYLDVSKRETAECLWMFVTRDSNNARS